MRVRCILTLSLRAKSMHASLIFLLVLLYLVKGSGAHSDTSQRLLITSQEEILSFVLSIWIFLVVSHSQSEVMEFKQSETFLTHSV